MCGAALQCAGIGGPSLRTPVCSWALARPLLPAATWGRAAAAGGAHPSLPHRELLQAGGASATQEGKGGARAARSAHRGGSTAPVALLGRGSVLRRQRVAPRVCQISAWVTALSSLVKAPSQGEAGRAAFKAQCGGGNGGCLALGVQHCALNQHLRPAGAAVAAPAACASSQPLLWLFRGRKAPGSFSPIWQTVSENASGMSLPAPAL